MHTDDMKSEVFTEFFTEHLLTYAFRLSISTNQAMSEPVVIDCY
jgi:hypothetical protein